MLYVEVRLDKKKKWPDGAASALVVELNTRLRRQFSAVEATVRLARMNGLSVRGGTPADRECVEAILQETWETADEWFQPD